MKNLKYWLAVAFIGQASYGFAQYEVDALRFSQTQPSGTARSLGVGGATVAVGADLGNLVTNPAGLGLYQRSEFSFTPGLGLGSTESHAFGSTATDSRNSLHVASLGAAFVNRRPDSDNRPWRGGTFAIGLNRINDYNQSFRYRGTPPKDQDILQRLSDPVNSIDNILDQDDNQRYYTLDGLAYGALLTDLFLNQQGQDSLGLSVPFQETGELLQTETVLTTGSQTQFDLGYGASYRDRLYLGGAIGFISTRYNSTSTLTATDPAPAAPNTPGSAFGSLTYREVLETRGSGINARIGAIYRVNDAVRLGASVQTPTLMRLSESYNSSLQANFDRPLVVDGQSYDNRSVATDLNEFDYVLTSPFRASGGVAVVIGKYGFLSGDLEYVNYGQARLSNDDNSELGSLNYDFDYENDAIRSLYRSAVNLRLGGELRFDIFRLRAGYARYGDPYKRNDFNRTQNYFTAGAGLRQQNFFLDIAGVYGTNKRFYSPYTLSDASATPVVNVDGNRYTTTLTAGFLF